MQQETVTLKAGHKSHQLSSFTVWILTPTHKLTYKTVNVRHLHRNLHRCHFSAAPMPLYNKGWRQAMLMVLDHSRTQISSQRTTHLIEVMGFSSCLGKSLHFSHCLGHKTGSSPQSKPGPSHNGPQQPSQALLLLHDHPPQTAQAFWDSPT